MKTILVVDDDPQAQEYLRDVLEKAGYRVSIAEDGRKALRMVVEQRPDLVLLDIMMPEVHGYSVCHQIKSNEATKGTKVVFLSAKSFPADRRQAEQVGADGFITKPISSQELLEALRPLL